MKEIRRAFNFCGKEAITENSVQRFFFFLLRVVTEAVRTPGRGSSGCTGSFSASSHYCRHVCKHPCFILIYCVHTLARCILSYQKTPKTAGKGVSVSGRNYAFRSWWRKSRHCVCVCVCMCWTTPSIYTQKEWILKVVGYYYEVYCLSGLASV